MREVFGPILRFLLRPTCIGALYVSALAWLAARAPAPTEVAATGAPTSVAEVDLPGEAGRATIAVMAAAIAIGALLGVASGLVVALRDRMARAPKRTLVSRAVATLGVTVAAHAWLVLRAMARAPQLYAGEWYARGGARRTVQIFATDVLRPSGVLALGALALVVYLAGPPSRWRGWPRRLRRAFMPPRSAHAGRAARHAAGASALSALAALGAMALIASVAPMEARGNEGGGAPIGVARAGAAAGRPNVVVLAFESLRADRLTERTAPALAALASRGVRFDRAYASLPSALPSWITLFTGRYPHHHGVRSSVPRWEDRARDFDALPARLARAGYRTEAVGDGAGDVFSRVDLGFSRVEAPASDPHQAVRRRALQQQTPLLPLLLSRLGRAAFPALRTMNGAADPGSVADDAIRAVGRAPGQPFFLAVLFSSPRAPYAAPAPYYGRFTRAAYRGRFKYDASAGGAPPDDDDVAQIRGLYDGAVASADAAAARVLSALTEAHLAESTIVVITSDHGEALFEAGRGRGDGAHLFGDEATHIPLAIYDPRRDRGEKPGSTPREGGRAISREIVRDVDLAPTLYALTGVDAPPDLDGRSLPSALTGNAKEPASQPTPQPIPQPTPAPAARALAYAETDVWLTEEPAGVTATMRLPYPAAARLMERDAAHGDELVLRRSVRTLTLVAKHRMARDDRWKLVYAPTRMGVKYMLFDTHADPAETRNVAADHPAELARLKAELLAWMAHDPEMRIAGDALVPRDLTELSTEVGEDAATRATVAPARGP